MMATRKLHGVPKVYETVESEELSKEQLQHNSRIVKFIKEMINERKAKVAPETMVRTTNALFCIFLLSIIRELHCV